MLSAWRHSLKRKGYEAGTGRTNKDIVLFPPSSHLHPSQHLLHDRAGICNVHLWRVSLKPLHLNKCELIEPYQKPICNKGGWEDEIEKDKGPAILLHLFLRGVGSWPWSTLLQWLHLIEIFYWCLSLPFIVSGQTSWCQKQRQLIQPGAEGKHCSFFNLYVILYITGLQTTCDEG